MRSKWSAWYWFLTGLGLFIMAWGAPPDKQWLRILFLVAAPCFYVSYRRFKSTGGTSIFGKRSKVDAIGNRALAALQASDYPAAVSAVAELWRFREGSMGAGHQPSSAPILETVDEWVSTIVDRAQGKIANVKDTSDFFQWLKACVVAQARQQAAQRAGSIADEALRFVNATGLGRMDLSMFGPQAAGRSCPAQALSAIHSLLNDYSPELAALIIVGRLPPPLAGTFMFTLWEMDAVTPRYSDRAAAVVARALCWIRDFDTAERNLRQIPNAEMKARVRTQLNQLALDHGWSSAGEFFS
jgi:hypothetical protein